MKLLFCRRCLDIVKLQLESRACQCGQSSGYCLPDGWHAEVKGPAEVVGIANDSFRSALANLLLLDDAREAGVSHDLEGIDIKAWVMTRQAPRVRWVA